MSVHKLVVAFAIALASGQASAQQFAPPTDTDLKASYCVRALQRQLAGIPLGQTEQMDNLVYDTRDRLNRLQSYLIPRITYLDATGLLAAAKRADVDGDQYRQRLDRCTQSSCKQDDIPRACADKIGACIGMESELQLRMQSCSKLDWLPF